MSLTIEKIQTPSTRKVTAVTILSVVTALATAAIIFSLYGLSPWTSLDLILTHTLGTVHGWSEVVRRATPVLIIGLGMLVGAQAQLWNVGADGQLLIGAVASSGIALYSGLPNFLLLPAMLALAVVTASCWAMVPTLLKAKLGISEIMTGLMMNYIAANLVDYLIQGPWRGNSAMGFAYTNSFPLAAWLPLIPGTRICWVMTLAGVIGALIFHVCLFHTPTGFRIRVFGQSVPSARYAGISANRVLIIVALASGGMAGIAGTEEIAGVHHKLLSPDQITNGYGFTAVIAATLARGRPLFLIPSSILLGIILASGDVITVVLHLPMAIIGIFTGLILYFLICGEFFLRYRVRWVRRAPQLTPAMATT